MYTSVEWETLCREVSKLRLAPRSGERIVPEMEVVERFQMFVVAVAVCVIKPKQRGPDAVPPAQH